MPAPVNQTIKLRDVVYSYSESAKKSEAEFLRLWRICFRGFKQMGLNGFWEPRTTKLIVNANMTASLPGDCIKWVKVGTTNSRGEFQTLARNLNLNSYRDNGPNRVNDLTPETQAALLGPYWFNGEGFYGSNYDNSFNPNPEFGAGSQLLQPGEFNVDELNRVILLNTNYQFQFVYLMYLRSPSQSFDYEIPMQYEEAMIAWLAYQDISNLPSTGHVNNNNVAMRAKTFASQLKLAKKMYRPFNIAEAEQYYRQSFLYGVKG